VWLIKQKERKSWNNRMEKKKKEEEKECNKTYIKLILKKSRIKKDRKREQVNNHNHNSNLIN